jgi:hypothetical protein
MKHNFTNAIRDFLSASTGKLYSTENDMMLALEQIGVKGRWGMWKVIADKLDVRQQQAHDYYYNTWQMQFFEDPRLFKQEIRDCFLSNSRFMDEQEAMDKAADQIMQKYPDKKFYRTSLLMQLYSFKNSKLCQKMKKSMSASQPIFVQS